MSHFTSIKVQIKNGEVLRQVLEDLGHKVECNARVRGYRGDTTQAEYVIRGKNGYDFGFRRNGESYEIIADFSEARVNTQQFVNSITQKYAHKTLMATIQEQGFNLEEEEVLEDGTVKVVVGRWV
jgi:YbbR domain-containing protein